MAGTATYSIERGDACSRVRLEIGDRDPATAFWTDADIYSILRETARPDFLALSCTATGVTGATVEVRNGAASVELVLQRTTAPAENPDVFELSLGRDYDKVGDLVDAILDLDKGWTVRLGLSPEGDPVEIDGDQATTEPRARIAYAVEAGLLEITDGTVNVFGGVEDEKRLALYNLSAAASRLRKLRELDAAEEVRAGDVTIRRRALQDLAAATAMPSALGVFTRPL